MHVRVERSGNRILLGSDRPTYQLGESVPGAYFRKDKTWSLPLSLTTCLLLREKFGDRLQIGPALWSWAKMEKASRGRLTELSVAADAELCLLGEAAPKLAQAMESRTYQRVAARFIADTRGRDGRRRTLLADTVGLGKTAEALAAVLESNLSGPFLIVCPKTAVNATWKAEINRWLLEDQVVTIPEGKAARDKSLDALLNIYDRTQSSREPVVRLALARTWVVIHPAAIRTQTWWICAPCGSQTKYRSGVINELDCGHSKDRTTRVKHEHTFPQLFGIRWGAMIVDESDQILIRKTATPNLQRRGAEMLRDCVEPNGGLLLAMSGTPFRSKPHQIWSTLNWLDNIRFSSKWTFIRQSWKTTSGVFGGMSIGTMLDGREEMLRDELSDILLRRTRDQVRGDLPPKNYGGTPLIPGDETSPVGVWLPMEGAQLKAYRQMQSKAEAEIAGGTVTAIGVLAEMTRLKQFAGAEGEVNEYGEFKPRAAGNKYEWLLGFLHELGFPHDPATRIVVASQFTQLLNAFAGGVRSEFKIPVRMITGEQSQALRDEAIELFEDPKSDLDILFINTKAGGSSITLDAADVMVILDETWVDDEQEQLEGRIDNRQPERRIAPRTYYYVRSLDSIEEQIAVANAEAKEAGKSLLDGGTKRLAERVLTVRTAFRGGPERKIRRCRNCGVVRNQYHIGDCRWEGE